MKIIRLTKISLVLSVAIFLFLVVLNNLTDYGSNYLFVENVLGMTTVFEGNELRWRAIESPTIHMLFYWSIIAWEALAMIIITYGSICLLQKINSEPIEFQRAKTAAVLGLVVTMLQWFLAFITVGGEWFTMWQSEIWNGQDAAFRMFACIGIILIFVYLPEYGDEDISID
jgi:predicted small integral membrane protein